MIWRSRQRIGHAWQAPSNKPRRFSCRAWTITRAAASPEAERAFAASLALAAGPGLDADQPGRGPAQAGQVRGSGEPVRGGAGAGARQRRSPWPSALPPWPNSGSPGRHWPAWSAPCSWTLRAARPGPCAAACCARWAGPRRRSPRSSSALAHGADTELNRYYLAALTGREPPPAAPRQYVQSLFDSYAQGFEEHLVEVLNYRAPAVLVDRLRRNRPPFRGGAGPGLRHRPVRSAAQAPGGPARRRSTSRRTWWTRRRPRAPMTRCCRRIWCRLPAGNRAALRPGAGRRCVHLCRGVGIRVRGRRAGPAAGRPVLLHGRGGARRATNWCCSPACATRIRSVTSASLPNHTVSISARQRSTRSATIRARPFRGCSPGWRNASGRLSR